MKYRNISSHLEDIADGRAVDPGEYFELTEKQAKDPYNAAKISELIFIAVPKNPPTVDEFVETKNGDK